MTYARGVRLAAMALALAMLPRCPGYGAETTNEPLFRFVVLADTHIASAADLNRFRNFLHTVRGQGDFLLLLGDLCGQSPEYLTQIREVTAHSGWTVHTLPGNHDDDYAHNADWYYSVYSKMFYAFDHKGWRFVMNWSQSQPREWLKQQVAALPPEMPLVFCQHYPMPIRPEDAAVEPWPELAKCSNLALCLTGHTHLHNAGRFGDKPWVTLANCFFNDDVDNPGEYAIAQVYRGGTCSLVFAKWQNMQLQEPSDHLPMVKLAEPVALSSLRGPVVFRGTAQDDRGVQWVEYNVDRGPWVQATGTNNWNFVLDTTRLANGHHAIQISNSTLAILRTDAFPYSLP